MANTKKNLKQKEFNKLYEQLNDEQRIAVDTIDGPVMVVAGPGTGKTQVLTMRVAKILQTTQMRPENILCLTFTDSGVTAMRERLIKIIGQDGYYVRINTFHSFCNEVIQEHADVFALNKGWQALSDVERVEILQEAISRLSANSPLKPMGYPYLYLNDVVKNIQDLKKEDISPKKYILVLEKIDSFITATGERMMEFYKLTPKQRTDQKCEEIVEILLQEAHDAELPNVLINIVEKKYKGYQEDTIGLDEKEASKARTVFKNDLKKWHDQLTKQLPRQKELYEVYKEYLEMLKDKGRYDYEDMIIMVIRELKKNNQLLLQYQEQFQYLLVDEYQDTNGAQNEIVDLLSNFDDTPNVFVVGDDKQSIYRFQGASLNNMLDFYLKHKEKIKVVSLQNNYRSQADILLAANACITKNKESLAKYIPEVNDVLISATGRKPEKVKIREMRSEMAEDYFVANSIRELIEEGATLQEIAVLCRNNKDISRVFDNLRKMKIPVRLEAGENILEDIDIKQILTLLKFLAGQQNEQMLAEILQYDWWQMNQLDVFKAIYISSIKRYGLVKTLSSRTILEEAGVSDIDRLIEFVEKLARWKQASVNKTLQRFLTELLNESGWLDYVLSLDDSYTKLQKVTRLLNEVKKINQTNHELTINDFCKHVELLNEHNISLSILSWQIEENSVRLMTAHKAKGLEFEHVFIIKANDKKWGNNRRFNRLVLPHGFVKFDNVVDEENNEDERRLFYVAMTRAKQGLVITRFEQSDNDKPTTSSLFLDELGKEAIEKESISKVENEDEMQKVVLRTVKHDKKTRIWTKGLLTNYVMSVTHLNNYLECPRKFYFRNLLRVPGDRTVYQSLGSAVHGALEKFVREQQKTEKMLSKQKLINWFEESLEEEILSDYEAGEVRQRGEKILSEYYDEYKTNLKKPAIVEYNFRSNNVRIGKALITGKVDKIELVDGDELKDGALIKVIDYKTGNADRGMSGLRKGQSYWRQLVFYKLLCDNARGFKYKMRYGEIDFIQKSITKKKFLKKTIDIEQEDIDELSQVVEKVWDEIHNLNFLDGKETPFCGKCEYCEKTR